MTEKDFQIISDKVLEQLENHVDKKRPNFIVFCFDIPSENIDTIDAIEKNKLLLKRMNWNNYIDKYSTFVNNSVYMIPYEKLSELIDMFENTYQDCAGKYDIDLKLLGVAFNNDMVKDIIVNRLKALEKEVRNIFENILDTKKADKKTTDKIFRDYKRMVKKMNIARNHRIADLQLLDKVSADSLRQKLNTLFDVKYDVNRKLFELGVK